MFEKEQKLIEQKITAYCQGHDLPITPLRWASIPFSGEWGLATSLFELAALETKQGKKLNVSARAAELAEEIKTYLGVPEGFAHVEAVKGYLNLYFSTRDYAQRVIKEVLERGENYGRAERNHKQVMVEFSHPNTHKAFHVGHLRSAILGDVVSRLLDFSGYDVIRANYPGDIGMHVIKWMWNYRKFHKGEKPEKDITKWMGELYAEGVRRLEENPELESELRELYALWDKRDPEVVRLWEESREWSLNGFKEMYAVLDIKFDRYYFNSIMEQPGKKIVQELIDKGIAIDERPEGAVIVKIDELLGLKNETYRVLVALRSDSTALYATEDFALAVQKFTDYPELKKSLYVVDVRQSLHFQQVFKTLEIAGYPWTQKCQHIPYELVSLPGNVTMASREGTVVLLEDLIREATKRAREIVEQKNPELSEEIKNQVAMAVAIGAIKYPMLSRDNTKIVTFDWQSAMDINGQAAPYIQYAYVRANSILRKMTFNLPEAGNPEYDISKAEIELIDRISRFPQEVVHAASVYRPLEIANYAYDLAEAFNSFYTQCPVLQAKEKVRNFRLRLVAAAKQTIMNSLALLGITAPEAM
jgi:arginyl-tRNA synthetase